jgi:hypothetical protein
LAQTETIALCFFKMSAARSKTKTFFDLLSEELREITGNYYESAERQREDLEDEKEMRQVDRAESLRWPPGDDIILHVNGIGNNLIPIHRSQTRNMRENYKMGMRHGNMPYIQKRMMLRKEDPEGTENFEALKVKRWIRKKGDRRLASA